MQKKHLIPYKTPYTKIRIGSSNDGGYILLKEIFDKTNIVYSYGIGTCNNFDNHCAIFGKQIFMYDHTISELPSYHENFHFFKEPLNHISFTKNIKLNNHEKENNICCKIDVEGDEYDVILNNNDFHKYYSQLIIEFHKLDFYNVIQEKVLEKIQKYYYITHIHGNNTGITNWLPQTLEISFIRKDLLLNPIIEDISYPISGLDAKNYPLLPDYFLNWWITKLL